jgi:hypothetical protein
MTPIPTRFPANSMMNEITELYLRGINMGTPEELHFFWNPEVGIQTNINEIDYTIPST